MRFHFWLPLLSHSFAAHHPRETASVPASLPLKFSSSPPFTQCKEEQQQLNCLFYSPNSLYEKRIDHSSPLLA